MTERLFGKLQNARSVVNRRNYILDKRRSDGDDSFMTPDQFRAVQNAARAAAAEASLEWLSEMVGIVLGTLPAEVRSDFLTAVRAKVEAAKAEYLAIALRGRDPAESDLIAGEFQESFERITDEMLKRLGEQR